jgi:hypothetical protein
MFPSAGEKFGRNQDFYLVDPLETSNFYQQGCQQPPNGKT